MYSQDFVKEGHIALKWGYSPDCPVVFVTCGRLFAWKKGLQREGGLSGTSGPPSYAPVSVTAHHWRTSTKHNMLTRKWCGYIRGVGGHSEEDRKIGSWADCFFGCLSSSFVTQANVVRVCFLFCLPIGKCDSVRKPDLSGKTIMPWGHIAYINNSLHLARKHARVYICPRTLSIPGRELWGTDNV